MTDGIDVTAGSGTKIATDEDAIAGHVQIMKLAVSANGDATLVPVDATTGVLVRLSGAAAAIPISDNSGSITVDGLVAVTDNSGSLTVDDGGSSLTVDGTVTVQDGGGSVSIDDGGGSITIDGTVTITDGSGPVGIDDAGGTITVDDGGTTLSIDDGGGVITVDGTVAVSAVTDTPASARDTDSQSAALASDALMVDLTALTPKFAVIDAATSGNNTIVAAVTSKKIRVVAAFLVAAGTVTARFESGADGTALTGQMNLVANTGFVLPFNPVGWFESASGVLLNLELSLAVSVDGCLVYIEVP